MKAKSLKKPSDEDKSRLKKSKSAKRKRSYSPDSSDSGRKKPRKSKKIKKKPRKKPRQVSIPPTSSSYSSDYSVSSCATCEKRKTSHSKSPISRGNGSKSKVRKGRVSTGSKYTGRERGRSHRRSRSCSTCSSSSTHSKRSTSPSRSKRLRKGREKAEKARVTRRAEGDRDEGDKVVPENEPIAEAAEKVVPEKTQNDNTKKTGVVVDVELILRQKALENFIKFHKVKKCGISDERGEPVSNESNEKVGSVPGTGATDKEREESTLDEPVSVKRPKLRSIIIIPREMEISEDNTTTCIYNTGEVSNGIKDVPNNVEDEPKKGSEPNPNPNPSSSVVSGLRKDVRAVRQHETTSGGVDTGGAQYEKKTFSRMHDGEDELKKGSERNPNPNPSSSVVSGLRKDAGAVRQHEITSGGVNTGGAQYEKKTSRMHDGEDEPKKGSERNPNPNPSSSVVSGLRNDAGAVQQHETTSGGVNTGGAQYEKKTFSRMRDGETVQVSYNVYIPKKAPALARRKLQRGETSTS